MKNPGELTSNRHAFVAIFGNTPGAPTASAVLAGIGVEQANAVAIDNVKKLIHITGVTSSPDFLTNIQAPAATAAQPNLQSEAQSNAFYVALPNTLASVSYGSFLGGWNNDSGNAIAVDKLGNAYIAGTATSWATGLPAGGFFHVFPVQPPQTCASGVTAGTGCMPATNPPTPPVVPYTFTSGTHAFVAAFNPNGANTATSSTLLYSLPIGGDINPAEVDVATAVTVDDNNNVYVGGAVTNPSQVNGSTGGEVPTAIGTNGTGPLYNNVVFTAPGNGVLNNSAAGPGVVASLTLTPSSNGDGYAVGDSITFSAPQLPGGTTATGFVTSVTAGPLHHITGMAISNQGSGYTAPPSVTIVGGDGTATATATVGVVIMGDPTIGGQDGWVIELNSPGNITSTFNGGYLSAGLVGQSVGGLFPSFVFGTLVNGDETNGNGTGVLSPSGGIYQVYGLVTDASATPGSVPGEPGYLENIYITGGGCSSTDGTGRCTGAIESALGTGGSLGGVIDEVIIRRRINGAGFDQVNHPSPDLSTSTVNPFTATFPVQSGVVTLLGDLDLGVASALPASVAVTNTAASQPTLASPTSTGYTVTLKTASQTVAVPVGTTVTVSGIVTTPIAITAANPSTGVTAFPGLAVLTVPATSQPLIVGQSFTVAGVTPAYYNGSFVVISATTTRTPAATAGTTMRGSEAGPRRRSYREVLPYFVRSEDNQRLVKPTTATRAARRPILSIRRRSVSRSCAPRRRPASRSISTSTARSKMASATISSRPETPSDPRRRAPSSSRRKSERTSRFVLRRRRFGSKLKTAAQSG